MKAKDKLEKLQYAILDVLCHPACNPGTKSYANLPQGFAFRIKELKLTYAQVFKRRAR